MDVVGVNDEHEQLEPEEDSVPSGALSPLDLLRGKRAELDKHLFLDLPVPRWDEVLGARLWVRYKPGDPAVLNAAVEKREKAHAQLLANGGRGDPFRMTKANADFLVAACVAVYSLPLGTEPPSEPLDGGEEYPTFSSKDLSEAVGSGPTAVETVRRIYATDGDLMVAASQLLEWSGRSTPKAEADFLGN